MGIKIITDSASDINQNELENVIVLPLTVTFTDAVFKDGVNITKDEFYQRLIDCEEIPSSSLISPAQFEEAFAQINDANDEAIVITISSVLSGTYQSALIANEGNENISVIDSKQVAGSQAILVKRALDLINEGLTREEIVSILEEEKKHIHIFAAVDTLTYLQKGGRISKGTAIIGGVLNIKPILTLDDGALIVIGKARGSKNSNSFLNEKLSEVGGIDFNRPYLVGYSGCDSTNLMKYIENNTNLFPEDNHDIEIRQIGIAVGTHCGPGTVLVTFFSNK